MARSECTKKAGRNAGFFKLDAWWSRSRKEDVFCKECKFAQELEFLGPEYTAKARAWLTGGGSHTNGDIATAQWIVHDIALRVYRTSLKLGKNIHWTWSLDSGLV